MVSDLPRQPVQQHVADPPRFHLRSTDKDYALGVTAYDADFRNRVRTSVPASVIIMIWSQSSTAPRQPLNRYVR